jgi:heme exporter protein D
MLPKGFSRHHIASVWLTVVMWKISIVVPVPHRVAQRQTKIYFFLKE